MKLLKRFFRKKITDLQVLKHAAILQSSAYFDAQWYAKQAKLSSLTEPLQAAVHYLQTGAAKGLAPSPAFSTEAYLERNRDVAAAGMNPLLHFVSNGLREGRHARPINFRHQALVVNECYGPVDAVLPVRGQWQSLRSSPRICLHLHMYHEEMAASMLVALKNIEIPFTLLVSICSENDTVLTRYFAEALPLADVEVRQVENRGRDVAPWVVAFRDRIREHDLFCHIHSKASVHTPQHEGWREFLMHNTLGSPTFVSSVLKLFEDDDHVGLICPAYFKVSGNSPNWGHNKSVCEPIFHRMGGETLPIECPDFPMGSFFWAKTSLLQPLWDANIVLDDFPPEAGQVDATFAHGIERSIGLLPKLTGHTVKMVVADETWPR